jgi:hypothetical protein
MLEYIKDKGHLKVLDNIQLLDEYGSLPENADHHDHDTEFARLQEFCASSLAIIIIENKAAHIPGFSYSPLPPSPPPKAVS